VSDNVEKRFETDIYIYIGWKDVVDPIMRFKFVWEARNLMSS
jgi:hypothetical protein